MNRIKKILIIALHGPYDTSTPEGRANETIVLSSGGIIKIGNETYFNRNCNIVSRGSISVGDATIIGPNVCIYDHNHYFGKNVIIKEQIPDEKFIIQERNMTVTGIE